MSSSSLAMRRISPMFMFQFLFAALAVAAAGAAGGVDGSKSKMRKMLGGGFVGGPVEFQTQRHDGVTPIVFDPALWYLYREEHRPHVLPPGWHYRKVAVDVEVDDGSGIPGAKTVETQARFQYYRARPEYRDSQYDEMELEKRYEFMLVNSKAELATDVCKAQGAAATHLGCQVGPDADWVVDKADLQQVNRAYAAYLLNTEPRQPGDNRRPLPPGWGMTFVEEQTYEDTWHWSTPWRTDTVPGDVIRVPVYFTAEE